MAESDKAVMQQAFNKFILTLSSPVQQNIRDSMGRGESITFDAFNAGYSARISQPVQPAEQGDGKDAITEKIIEIQEILDETYNFASTSPRGQQNINAVSELLNDIAAIAQPVQPNNLEAAVFEAWEHYERTGSVCRFEGRSMIYASTLEEIYEAAIAQPVALAVQAEPVAWIDPDMLDVMRSSSRGRFVFHAKQGGDFQTPIFTRPPTAQPVQPATHDKPHYLSIERSQGIPNLGTGPSAVFYSDSINGCMVRRDDVWLALTSQLAQPVQPHDLPKRLADLHQYEEIAEHYAKCAISPEALRDWVADRMDKKPVQPHKNTSPDSLEVASLWAAFDASAESKRCLEWAINGDHKGALFVAFRAGLREAIAQPVQTTTHNFEMTAPRIELLATMLHCVPTGESELFKELNAFCHDARTAFNKEAIAQPVQPAKPVYWRVRRLDSPDYWIVFMHYPVDAMADPEREVQPLYIAQPLQHDQKDARIDALMESMVHLRQAYVAALMQPVQPERTK